MITYYRQGLRIGDKVVKRKSFKDKDLARNTQMLPAGSTFTIKNVTRGDEVELDIYWMETLHGLLGLCTESMKAFTLVRT